MDPLSDINDKLFVYIQIQQDQRKEIINRSCKVVWFQKAYIKAA